MHATHLRFPRLTAILRLFGVVNCTVVLVAALFFAGVCRAQSSDASKGEKGSQQSAAGTTKLTLVITGNTGKPIGNATVYVRFPESGGFLRHQKLAELDLKTNEDGKVKVPEIPQGKILIQVLAKGWHTFGKWYEVQTESQTIEIKLDPPPHWY